MNDVARAAEVSLKTVSRVVNNEAGVSQPLVDRVRAAVDELGYRPDLRARNLRGAEAPPATIGFIQTYSANPFFSAIRDALEAKAAEHDCLILSGSSGADRRRQDVLVEALLGRRVDGLVIVPAADGDADVDASLQREIDRGTPVVFVDRNSDAGVDVVLSDHFGGAFNATAHLTKAGHTRIAFLGRGSTLQTTIDRLSGYESALREAEVDPAAATRLIRVDVPSEDAEATVRQLLALPAAQRPTAIFSSQNQLTKGAVKALHGLGVQRDVALVGFDDIEMADVIEPGVTVVAQNAEKLGRYAAELLFERLLDGRTEPARRVVPVELITRGSGEIAARR